LESLKLSDDEIREKLTTILSSQPSFTLSRFLESFFQPFRSKISDDKITIRSGFIYPAGSLAGFLISFFLFAVLLEPAHHMHLLLGQRIFFIVGCSLGFLCIYSLLTNIANVVTATMSPESLHFYSPEPDGGIEVIFELLPEKK